MKRLESQQVRMARQQELAMHTTLRTSCIQAVHPKKARTFAEQGDIDRRQWRSKLDKRYPDMAGGELVCFVLKNLFPTTLKQQHTWAKGLGWGSPFPAVGEHIVPTHQRHVALANNLVIEDGSN
eukprot:4000489-Amphidinium_carterae.1